MLNWHCLSKVVLCIGIFLPWTLSSGKVAAVPKQDRSWKQYRNTRWGYCVNYPSRWARGDAYDGAGLFVKTGLTKYSASPSGEIDVSVQTPPYSVKRSAVLDLADSMQFHLEGIAKFQRAQQMEVMETRRMTLADSPALFTKDQYFDPLERAAWMEEVIFASRGDQLYRLELVCLAKDAKRFEPVFQQMVNSFSFNCTGTR
jgi:hypothetical protein